MTNDMIAKLSAYLDGELDEAARIEVEAALESNESLREAFDRMSRVESTLRPAYAETLKSRVPERFVQLLATGPSRRPLLPESFLGRLLRPDALAIAAVALVAGLLAGPMLGTGSAGGLVEARDGVPVAGLALGSALSSARSGESGDVGGLNMVVRMSFRSKAGELCREYQLGGSAGVACRRNDAWTIEAMAAQPGLEDGSFALASGGAAPEIAAAISRLGVVDALDADAEAKATASGWK